jgi:hypothetical protein
MRPRRTSAQVARLRRRFGLSWALDVAAGVLAHAGPAAPPSIGRGRETSPVGWARPVVGLPVLVHTCGDCLCPRSWFIPGGGAQTPWTIALAPRRTHLGLRSRRGLGDAREAGARVRRWPPVVALAQADTATAVASVFIRQGPGASYLALRNATASREWVMVRGTSLDRRGRWRGGATGRGRGTSTAAARYGV